MFTDEPVPDEIIENALMVANLAPSAGNLQARDFVIVRDEKVRKALARGSPGHRFLETVSVIIVCCRHDRIISTGPAKEPVLHQDVSVSIENMLLYLAASGYGACWIGTFDEEMVASALGLPCACRRSPWCR